VLLADDTALFAHSKSTLQTMMERVSQACKFLSLQISAKETVIVTKDGATQGNKPLEVVKKFSCLGSTLTLIATLDCEICVRIGKALSTFQSGQTANYSSC